jgi:hypothetical protein
MPIGHMRRVSSQLAVMARGGSPGEVQVGVICIIIIGVVSVYMVYNCVNYYDTYLSQCITGQARAPGGTSLSM